MDFNQVLGILRDIPDYSVFLTVDELKSASHALARKYPKVVQVILAGRSRQGDAIEVLKIGSGQRKALLFAMPHPNEPIGSMMLEYLSSRLAEDDALRDQLGYTWFLIKCIDPDGTRLNEGWFKGPFSIESYARHYYRPPSFQQVEWTFPIDYRTLHFHRPMPETQVLMDLIGRERPDFIFSLHNAGFGGVYYYITEEAPSLYEPFHRLAESQELPLHLGEPEMPYAVAFAPAIYRTPATADSYEYLLNQTGKDPAQILQTGTSSFDYARAFGDPFCLVCEMPYFYNPSIHDTATSDVVRRDAILANVEQSRADQAWLSRLCRSIEAELTVHSPFRDSIEYSLKMGPTNLDAMERWARSDPGTSRMATVAEKFDNAVIRRFYHLLSLGMTVRMVDAQIAASGATPNIKAARKEAEEMFDTRAKGLAGLHYTVIPIRKLAAVQLGAALVSAAHARKRRAG